MQFQALTRYGGTGGTRCEMLKSALADFLESISLTIDKLYPVAILDLRDVDVPPASRLQLDKIPQYQYPPYIAYRISPASGRHLAL